MIREMSEKTAQFLEQETSGWTDLGKLVIALALLGAMIIVTIASFALAGTYGKHWYGVLLLFVPILFGTLCVLILLKLDPRFLD